MHTWDNFGRLATPEKVYLSSKLSVYGSLLSSWFAGYSNPNRFVILSKLRGSAAIEFFFQILFFPSPKHRVGVIKSQRAKRS